MQLPTKILVRRRGVFAQLRLISRYNLALVATLEGNWRVATEGCGGDQLDPGLFLTEEDLVNMVVVTTLLFFLIKLSQVVASPAANLIDRLAVNARVTISAVKAVVVEMVGVGFDLQRLAALRPPGQVKIVIKEVLRHIVVTLIASVYSIGARAL